MRTGAGAGQVSGNEAGLVTSAQGDETAWGPTPSLALHAYGLCPTDVCWEFSMGNTQQSVMSSEALSSNPAVHPWAEARPL